MSCFSKLAIIALAASIASAVAVPTRVSMSSRDDANGTLIPGIEVGSTVGPVTPLDAATVVSEIVNSMRDATTQVGRFKALLQDKEANLLPDDELRQRTIFDFNSAKAAPPGNGGAIGVASIASFPIVADSGIAVAMGFLGPCGLNTPHTHPRATEFLTLIQGDRLESGFILENGFVGPDGKTPQEVRTSITTNQGTVFPVGSNHWQFNPTCDDVTFVAALSNDDPGTSQLAQNFFNLDGEVIEATLGFPEALTADKLPEFRKNIPVNVAEIVEQCVQKCGLKN
jgi:hypothetical protein